MRAAIIVTFLTLSALPALAATPCNLEITLTCNGAACTSTTFNRGATACAGDVIVAVFTEQPAATFANFTNTLGLTDCFDST